MDEADRAQSEVERSLAEAMRARRREGPPATGQCLWCDEPLEEALSVKVTAKPTYSANAPQWKTVA